MKTSTVRELSCDDRAAVRTFIGLGRRLRKADPLYVPVPHKDLRSRLSGRSALHTAVDQAMFVVSSGDGDGVACCAAFVHHRYQKAHAEAVGFIGYFAAAPSVRDEVRAVLARAEEWLASRGMTRVIAPVDASFLAGMGLRTAEFDREPLFPFQWHPPYYRDYFESARYRASYPWWSYRVDFGSEHYREVSRRAVEQAECRVRPISRRRWNDDIDLFAELYNEAFTLEWEYYPFLATEVREVYGPMKPVADPDTMLFAEVDGEAAGFCFGMPGWGPLIRKLDGKTGIPQLLRFMVSARRVDDAGLLWVGVRDAHRGRHIGQTLAATLYRRYERLGFRGAEYHLVNEANLGSRALATSLGGVGRVLYHNFDKSL